MLSHKRCWNDFETEEELWWWDNGVICPEQDHKDHF